MAEKKRFLLRVSEELYQVMEKWAADELRSVNAQMEFLLAEAARHAGRLPDKHLATRDGVDGESTPPPRLPTG
jgi:hypothetical protein